MHKEKSPRSFELNYLVNHVGQVEDLNGRAGANETQLLKNIGQNSQPITPEETRRLVWKVDLCILPLIAGTVILSAVDKVIISNAYIYGMGEDTNLTSAMFSWVGSIFYFGYLIFEYPSAILIQRLPVAKLLACLALTWAVLMCCTAATQNFAGLMVVRLIMGMSEAAAFPIASILTPMWYTKKEQPIRVAFWFNQFSSIFSGIISYGIGHTHTALAPWRLLLIVLGGISAVWGVVLWTFLPDHPMKCWYLSEREKYVAIERIRVNDTGIEERRIKWYQLRECLMDIKTWLLAIFICVQSIPGGCLVAFSAVIVSGMGYSQLMTTVLGIPTGILATAYQLILAVPCARLKNKRCIIISLANMVPVVCAVLMWQLPETNKHGQLAAYYVFYSYWGPYVMSVTLPMANTSGHTKKVTMNAIAFLAYCVGNIIGPQVFRGSDAPNYPKGYTGLLCCFIVASISISIYALVCKMENSRRDQAQGGETSAEADPARSFSDLTDKEKTSFRYTY